VGLVACLIAWNLPFTAPFLRHGLLQLAISVKFYTVFGLWIFFAFILMQRMMCTTDSAQAANYFLGPQFGSMAYGFTHALGYLANLPMS
jgi:hypothetical protein